jgi:hypothetical protein
MDVAIEEVLGLFQFGHYVTGDMRESIGEKVANKRTACTNVPPSHVATLAIDIVVNGDNNFSRD